MNNQPILRKNTGQSLVEFSLVLPFILLLLLGMVEVGMAFYDYIAIGNANREGVRLSSRGRFDESNVIDRIVAAGGRREVNGEMRNNLQLSGPDSNCGLILTTISIDPDGTYDIGAAVVTGTLHISDTVRAILPTDSRLDPADYINFHSDITAQISTLRDNNDFDPNRNDLVVVETFFAHDLLFIPFLDLLNLPDPMPLYFSSTMRVLRDSRID
ncbi:MAG: TadE/TadG family type IV pilus assembly protein [Chloroflexota bacterium]|nr:TadE/TadG family type IV pilus assembly protein [Chloroflexota bacterium]